MREKTSVFGASPKGLERHPLGLVKQNSMATSVRIVLVGVRGGGQSGNVLG